MNDGLFRCIQDCLDRQYATHECPLRRIGNQEPLPIAPAADCSDEPLDSLSYSRVKLIEKLPNDMGESFYYLWRCDQTGELFDKRNI